MRFILRELTPKNFSCGPTIPSPVVETRAILIMVVLAALAVPAGSDEVDDLILVLKTDINYNNRVLAASELGRINDPKAVDPLIEALKEDKEWEVRMTAAMQLDNFDDTRVADSLIAALREDEDSSVQVAAASSLGKIGDPRAVDSLIEALIESGPDFDVRWAAAESLGQIGDPRAIEPLTEAMKDENEYVRNAAESALEEIEASNESPLPISISAASFLVAALIIWSRKKSG